MLFLFNPKQSETNSKLFIQLFFRLVCHSVGSKAANLVREKERENREYKKNEKM